MMTENPNQLKHLFLLDPSIHFLNHGSFGATPRPVFEAYQRWQRELEAQPVEFIGRRAPALLAEARQHLANYLGTQANNLVYVTNATTGLNTVARSLALGPSDEVLTCDHEYGALDRTWQFLAGKAGFTYIRQPLRLPLLDRADVVDQLWQAVTTATRVIFLSHITSATALILPMQEICQRARAAGILTIIDGAHAPGQIDLNLDELGADFYAGNLHKWLCAPKGSAFLYARPERQTLVEPLVVSWGWQSDHPGASRYIDHLEYTGTRDISAFLAVPDAIRFQHEHNWPVVMAACHQLASETQGAIYALTGIPPIHSQAPGWFKQMAAAPLPPEIDPAALQAELYARWRIEIPCTTLNGSSYIRFSYQGYNSRADMDALLSALGQLL